MSLLVSPDVAERLERLDVPFNRYGLDPYGISRRHLAYVFTTLSWFYRRYFRCSSWGIEHVPDRGRAMLIGNHSGGVPVDGAMLMAALFLDKDPPRLTHGMVEKFAQRLPFVSTWFSRAGQFTGLPENAARLLADERLLMVFPEGIRGVGKLYKDRYRLVDFGTGFLRLALQTKSPIVPFAFIGGEEAVPTLFHIKGPARMVGLPYWPVPLQVLPIPLPVRCEIHFGKPLVFDGNGSETDDRIRGFVEVVKSKIAELIDRGREERLARDPEEGPAPDEAGP